MGFLAGVDPLRSVDGDAFDGDALSADLEHPPISRAVEVGWQHAAALHHDARRAARAADSKPVAGDLQRANIGGAEERPAGYMPVAGRQIEQLVDGAAPRIDPSLQGLAV